MIKWFNKYLAICAFSILATGFVSAEVLYKNTPFVRYSGYNTYRIPALIQAPNGAILAFAEGRASTSDTGNIDMVLRRSLDGGVTWQTQQVVWNNDSNTCGNPVPVVDESNGRIWLFMTHNHGSDTMSEINDGTSIEVRTIWSCYSDDNGVTWSTPVNRFSEVQNSDTKWDATGPGAGYQTKRGKHAGRLVIPATRRNIQSDDHGATWYQSAWLASGIGEAVGAELSNGALYSNNRPSSSAFKAALRRVVAYSYNEGDTSWTALKSDTNLIDPVCQGSVISYVDNLYGYMLLFSNPALTTRKNMTIKISYNDGKTWPDARPIYGDVSAYSCLANISDGMVGLLFENGMSAYYEKITFAKASLDWLRGHSIFLWDFEDYSVGDMISTTSGAVHDVDGYDLDGTCSAAMTVVAGSSANGGNSAVSFAGSSKITIGDTDSGDIVDFDANDSFMIRVVFKTSSHSSGGTSGAGTLVAKDVGSNSQSWWLRVQDGVLRFLIDDSSVTSAVVSSVAVSDGVWHNVLAIRDAVTHQLIIELDGVVVGTATDNTTGSFANSNDISIGKFNSGTCAFTGDIDKVQVFRGRQQDVALDVYDGNLNNDSIIDFSDLAVLMGNWLVFN